MEKFSFLGNLDINQIEDLYARYQENPENVDRSWRNFFEGFEFSRTKFADQIRGEVIDKEFKVINLVDWYRKRGHLFTETNPVRTRRKYFPTLDIENFGLNDDDLNEVFSAGQNIGIGKASLSTIIKHLEATYCRSIGVEYMFIRNPEKIEWLQKRMESTQNFYDFTADQKKHIYFHLNQAVGFEKFIHKKFVGQKRFSLEGAESLIPALDAVIEKGSDLGIQEFIIGMPHRGRLNVLANILQKPYEDIFNEYNGKYYDEVNLLGDVKYHLGYSNKVTSDNGKKIKLNLAPNPSHLEAVGPVVQGIARARIEYKYNRDDNKLAPIIIHGDAAIASQGVVYELLQMSQLEGYKTGGTIHLVINNQVGFTTNYLEARSSTYCTDIAKVIKAPVFHVNGDDPEALIYTIKLAMEYRQTFHTDIFIDLLCYRKYGHNEGDEPRFTQPILYKEIAKHSNVRDLYGEKLIKDHTYSEAQINTFQDDFNNILEDKFEQSKKTEEVHIQQFLDEDWKNLHHSNDGKNIEPDTTISKDQLLKIGANINSLPKNLQFFNKLIKLIDDRNEMLKKGILDWGMAELLAYGSLLVEGFPVRISGQDSERGTFSHRHASYVIEDSIDKFFPLKHVSKEQAPFHIYNSPLSEYGVLGFEYGYALTVPNGLTIWEAQFGDFSNVAQVIIDQYISSAQEKWNISNGLVLLLPHGYEGQGPEHSSARIERFLELCAHNNMQIINATSPANLFHVLRRHMKRDYRTPLVIFTPKSLLRHPRCRSTLDELANGKFLEVIDDPAKNPKSIKQVVLCSGKIYYELLERKESLSIDDIALIRVEQLYPFPSEQIIKLKIKYNNAETWIWAQDEPENMGAWSYIHRKFQAFPLLLVSRPESGSPATGLSELHLKRKEKLLTKIFKQCDCKNVEKYCGMKCAEN